MPYAHLLTRRDAGVEYLTLNRPEVRNAFNPAVIGELIAWADQTRTDSGVRAVVLAGAGKAFSAGADIQWMAESVRYSEAQNLRDAETASRLFATINALPVPVIGRVQGAALGGGAGLAAVCDIVVAESGATFGFTEVKLGIVPAVISPFVIEKIGRSAARELFLTGRRFTSQRAREIGLVHVVVAANELDDAVNASVREVLSAGPEAVATIKQLIADVWDKPRDLAGPMTARAIAARRVSAEGQEGLAAFLEKRKPRWSAE